MQPERWRQADQLFQAALERTPETRAAFVHAACGADDALRREVEALLAADAEAGSLMETPAYAMAAPLLLNHNTPSLSGRSVGHYEIKALLGRGGMGEVYRAHDLRLGREVALKLLPAAFTQQPERVSRFEREARAASALNHPNILTIHEIGETDDCHYIVSELVAGETLRAMLQRGRLSLSETTAIARQIASALGVAHEAGIIHRDIKPENVMVRPDGLIKVLDFGLAKLKPRQFDEMHETLDSITTPGMVLGTVAYMSPEQLRGAVVDERTDLFSLGLVIAEMLQGERPFQRATTAETIAAILHDEPPALSAAHVQLAPQLELIVRRCLEKQPERRFHSAHDLSFALATLHSSDSQRLAAMPASETRVWPLRQLKWLAAGALVLLALGFGLRYWSRAALEAESLRLSVNPPEGAKTFDWPTLSPDGRMLAFTAEVEGKTRLWVRALGAPAAHPLVEVHDNLPAPFWSPDSRFLAYFEQSKLKKIALAAGAAASQPEILCDVFSQSSGSWNRDGVILFGNGPDGLSRVSASGGNVASVTTVDTARGETAHSAPTFLPDGRHYFYWVSHADPAQSGIYLAPLAGGAARLMLTRLGAVNVGMALAPGQQREGWLTFVRQGALLAQPYDFSRNELMGNPVRIADYVPAPVIGLAHFSLALNGALVWQESEPDRQLVWFDRTGRKLGTVGPPGRYASPRLSPDEKRLAVSNSHPPAQADDVYLFDLASGASTPFTFDPSADQYPLWSPNVGEEGSRLAWTSRREGTAHIFQKTASGAGQDEVLLRSAYYKSLCDWSADGRFILYEELNPQTSLDLWVLPMTGEQQPWPWLHTPAAEMTARFSPDGKWIAYQSNESGRIEVYVQAFAPGTPAAGGKRQLSTTGGKSPRWRRDGRELYYLAADGKLMAVAMTPGAALQAGAPRALFTPSGFQLNDDLGYTLTGDGQRFLFVTNADEARVSPFTVLLNWMSAVQP